ncbi:hypothetical protein BH10BAC4_BH10BAC4_18070 [soil metagenome]
MMSIKKLVTAFVTSLVISNALGQPTTPNDIRVALMQQQKPIVSALSGASKIKENETLKQRWTKKEKVLTRGYLSGKLNNIGLTAQEQEYKVILTHTRQSLNPFKGTNLFAILPATESSDEYIVIGAHYDTVEESPGAMDNATGCALAFGVTQLITRLENRKKNIVIAFFDQEETGHAGSYAFANYVKEKKFKIHSVHTADMIGWDSDKDRSIELELPSPELESIYKRYAQSSGILAYTTQTTETDHREFRNAGYNAVGIGGEHKNGDESPHHHLPTDTFETVDFEYLAFVTYLVYKVVEELITE